MAKHIVGRADELAPGDRKIVNVAGRSIGIFNDRGTFHAVRNRCPHQGAELCRGMMYRPAESPGPGEYVMRDTASIIRCPWHGWEFDLETGRSWFDPNGTRVRSYDVEVESGAEIEAGEPCAPADPAAALVAQTYSVAVEAEYLVLEL